MIETDAVPPSRVTAQMVENAVKALLRWREQKSKDEKPQLLEQDEFVYLFVTLKKIPRTSRTNPFRIRLPHPIINTSVDSPEICLIIDDRSKSGISKEDAMKKIKSEDIPISKVIKLSKLRTNYRPFEAKRKLCDSYDMFFADRRVIPLLPRLLGKKFFKSKKIPVPIDLKHKNWKEQLEKACGSAMFFMRTGTCSVVKVGKLAMESDEIGENVIATVNGVAEIVPSKWKSIRSLHLKLCESLALPMYQSVPDLKLKIDASGNEKGVKAENGGEEIAKGDTDEIKSKEENASEKPQKKKGRIHEVLYMDSNVSETIDGKKIGVNREDKEIGEMGIEESGGKKRRMNKTGNKPSEMEKPVKKAMQKRKVDNAKQKEKSIIEEQKPKKQKNGGEELNKKMMKMKKKSDVSN
ncbi:PREDICTED: putative ribosome biogenesis protein C8F11.04 [Tarenaya hassleriana]|uniref:putative ribosome biogenesis protein C8F11.04 n=1 Tax=Tarenaya hassleriana TaxID=28532 RepID=UPI00053C2B6E|nr:PREDICTED: putative ribosome biogenesis protein C8F11.04 [Tarenaya hassleriana]